MVRNRKFVYFKYHPRTEITLLMIRKALLLLKKRKFTENLLNKTDSELMNIETLISDIEFKNLEQNVLKGMQIGNDALKQLNAVFSIEQIENILGETEESVEKQKVCSESQFSEVFNACKLQEINDLISGYKESDAESLNDELMAIIGVDETIKDEAEVEPSVDQTIELPDVPEDQPQSNFVGFVCLNINIFFSSRTVS